VGAVSWRNLMLPLVGLLGLWVVVAPFALRRHPLTWQWTDVVAGILVAGLAWASASGNRSQAA
jgi:hypothetical protein